LRTHVNISIDPGRIGSYFEATKTAGKAETIHRPFFKLKDEMITIRQLRQEDDLATVLSLCKAFFAEYEKHHEEFFDTDNLTDKDISGRFLQSLESDHSTTIIAVVADEIVGYASVVIRDQPAFYKIKKVGSISALMVAEEYRRRGIGTRIMEEAKLYFRQHGVKYYTFFTAVGNESAIRLYKKLGITPLHTSFLGKA
jgi:ribosomal protein S18 acetylase RimI-like enzyme